MPNPIIAPLDTATSIAKAIEKVADLIAQVLSGSVVRRLNYRLEAAQNYIFVNEKTGQYKELADNKRDEYLMHFRKRVFDS